MAIEYVGIKIGATYRDSVSGFEGIAISYVQHLNSFSHIGLQPKTDDKSKLPDVYSFDAGQLEFVDDGISAKAQVAIPCAIVLGDKVKDTITNFVGIATVKTIFLNGCIRFSVEAEDSKGSKNESSRFCDVTRLTVIKPAVKEPVVRKTGGPNLKAERF